MKHRPHGTGCVFTRGSSGIIWIKYYVMGVAVMESTRQRDRDIAEQILETRLHPSDGILSLEALRAVYRAAIRMYINLEGDQKKRFDFIMKKLYGHFREILAILDAFQEVENGGKNQCKG